ANACRSNYTPHAAKIHRPIWKNRFAYAGGISWAGAAARDSRFGASALRGCLTYASGDPVWADESVSLAANGYSGIDFTWKIGGPCDRICVDSASFPDERNLDGSGDQCYGFAAAASCGGAQFMSGAKPAKKNQSLWQTLRAASGPYRRLLGYIKPYKALFIVGWLL